MDRMFSIFTFIVLVSVVNSFTSMSNMRRRSSLQSCNNKINKEDILMDQINTQNTQKYEYNNNSGIYNDNMIFKHLGDIPTMPTDDYIDSSKKIFYLNTGKAIDTLARELPMIFAATNFDFSIFAEDIIVNSNNNKISLSKNMYIAGVKSMQLASKFSSMYPSMNIRKIEYVEDCKSIMCLVEVVLPDTFRIDGSGVWEGMFYFGLNEDGLISSHIFDRKITPLSPAYKSVASVMNNVPWLKSQSSWKPDMIYGRL